MVYKIDLSFDPFRCLDAEYLYPNDDPGAAWFNIKDAAGRDLSSYQMFHDRISDDLLHGSPGS